MKIKTVAENPNIGKEFRDRVLFRHDWNYLERFKYEMNDDKMQRIILTKHPLSVDKIKEIVNRLPDIEWLEVEDGKVQPDKNAAAILVLGKKAVPYLVEKITDEQKSNWLAWASIGDVAHMFLSIIYRLNWPSSKFAQEHGLKLDTPYLEYYHRFLKDDSNVKNYENRRKLQDAWERVVQDSEK